MIKENNMSSFLAKVYGWMFIGLLVSGAVAYYTAITPHMLRFVSSSFMFIVITELAVVIAFSFLRDKLSPLAAKIFFIVYSSLSGLTLSSIFIIYKLDSIGMVFLSSAIMFGLMALYGYFTKSNLSSFGKILLFALIAIIIMSVINLFTNNSGFGIVLSIISIVIFLGFTAYDMQMLKETYEYYLNDEDGLSKASIFGALNLYIDLINIFLNLLGLFGNRRD